jgi:hypothetical protein
MSNIVYASATCAAATADGIPVTLVEGEPWASDDPFVVARPEFFSASPPGPAFPRRTVAVVEQATAAPGERRNVRHG